MRLRPHRELVGDPNFPMQVGRLVGAAEMAAQLMMLGKLSAEELADVGRRLDLTATWFLTSGDQP